MLISSLCLSFLICETRALMASPDFLPVMFAESPLVASPDERRAVPRLLPGHTSRTKPRVRPCQKEDRATRLETCSLFLPSGFPPRPSEARISLGCSGRAVRLPRAGLESPQALLARRPGAQWCGARAGVFQGTWAGLGAFVQQEQNVCPCQEGALGCWLLLGMNSLLGLSLLGLRAPFQSECCLADTHLWRSPTPQ